jgi:hypothetical protein
VGYEDLTAIDWIFEYTKERQRQRTLHASSSASAIPALGHIQRLLDASQVWVVLVLAGLAVGALAAAIDVATDWLGDIKYGFCSSGVDSGRFYLSKAACCYGYDESSHCKGWVSWGSALGVSSGVEGWFVGYVFYLVLAVSVEFDRDESDRSADIGLAGHLCALGELVGQRICDPCQTQRDPRDQDGTWRLYYQEVFWVMDVDHEIVRFGKSAGALSPGHARSLTRPGSGGGVWDVARKRRATGSCRLLLRQFVYQAVSQHQR